jgi:hypothetical protein
MRPLARVAVLVTATTVLRVALRSLRHLGAQPTDVAAELPGDELLPDAALVTTRAVRIAARPEAVWPWLVQMGYGRGGWYAIDQLEKLIGAGDFLTGGSAREIVPELQTLTVGDRVPLSATQQLMVRHLDAPEALVLELADAPLAWVWSFTLHPDADACRLVIRTRVRARRRWVRPLIGPLDAGHAVMESVQLQRLRRRVEATPR